MKAHSAILTHKQNKRVWNCYHMSSSKRNKARTEPLASKVMRTIFWDVEGYTLVDFLLNGETINAACYVQTL
jgi:hypothetical protein